MNKFNGVSSKTSSSNPKSPSLRSIINQCMHFTTKLKEGSFQFFIVGSYARGTQSCKSDVDLLLFVDTYEYKQEIDQKFRAFYFTLHKKLHCTPDLNYPGELISIEEFNNAIEHSITENISSPELLYDALVWSSMLLGPQISITRKEHQLIALKERSLELMEFWRGCVAPNSSLETFISNKNLYSTVHRRILWI
ncbi:hypothetical protein BPLS_P0804 [Bathymodiolus platifrons methanotrophic gill symbiont]|nr:hypothetical protein BPLS_P0804 [Bathymodiolus platifrons methanotrophic gill symbiont]